MRKLLANIAGIFSPPRYPPRYDPVWICRVISADSSYFSADILRRAKGSDHAC